MQQKTNRITATPKQIEAHEALEKNTIVLYGGSIRGSKSFWGCMEIISFCFRYPKSRWLMLRKSHDVLLSTLLVTFRENFLNCGLDQYVKSFNMTTLILTWNNDSQIIFMPESYATDKELNRFRGLEINGGFIDEVNEIQEATFNKVIERSGSWFAAGDVPIKILMSCNPTFGWVKERFHDKWKNGTLPKGVAYIQARIFDNPYVPRAYLESLKMLSQFEYMVFVEGNWDIQLKTGGEYLEAFELTKHVKPVEYDDTTTVRISLDNNVLPYIAVSAWQLIKNGEGWIIRQFQELPAKEPENTASQAGKKIGRYLNSIGYQSRVFLNGDRSTKARNTIDDDKRSFFQIIDQNIQKEGFITKDCMDNKAPSVSDIGDFVNAILRDEVKGISIEIGENCKESISDYIVTKKDKDGGIIKKRITDPKTGASYEPNGHFTDNLKDLVYQAFKPEYEKWKNRFRNHVPTIGKNISRNQV
jgi:hypothetical protein